MNMAENLPVYLRCLVSFFQWLWLYLKIPDNRILVYTISSDPYLGCHSFFEKWLGRLVSDSELTCIYEDMNTFSAWLGYNFSGGNNFQYTITPMVGGIIGNTNGIAPGLEFDFLFYGFECILNRSMFSTSRTMKMIFSTTGQILLMRRSIGCGLD